ncbi:TPA: tyrosine-type recombinase/integrase [Streptococcus agalactiae]
MYYRTKTNSKGITRYEVVDKYKDPLTGKWKTAVVSYHKNTSRARKQAQRELEDKIELLINSSEAQFNPQLIRTFGELKKNWLETWSVSVKSQTVKREAFVLEHLGEIIGDDYLLERLTPLLMKKCLTTYMEKYNASQSTMTHIKSTCNKIFNHGVLYNVIPFSPMSVIKLETSLEKKREAKKKRDAKFLEIHEIRAFFETLSRRRNPNYYDLAIVLLFSGLRIGEAAFTKDDFDAERGVLHIDKALQYHDLKVSEFYFDDTKTINADRDVALPKVACDAILRAIRRSEDFDCYANANPCEAFTFSESVFRTEYGSPITSHSFREVLARVETELTKNCEERYGFKWTKHVTPHSFRHMHITYLQSEGMSVAIKEIMERVGHANYETTMLYTHSQGASQDQTIKALDNFINSNHFRFEALKAWSSKYSKILNDEIENNFDSKILEFTLADFREKLGLKSTYTPSHITANIIPKLKKDLSKYYKSFDISYLREGKQKVVGYRLTW